MIFQIPWSQTILWFYETGWSRNCWAAGAGAETQSKVHSCSCTCHLPLGELLDLCVHLLIHCPISQSKLIYLLEFCAVLDLEFRHSLLGRHLTDQEPNELVNLHSQSACQKTSCPLKIDNFILWGNFPHWNQLISCPVFHPFTSF